MFAIKKLTGAALLACAMLGLGVDFAQASSHTLANSGLAVKVESVLNETPGLNAKDIQVFSTEGVVTLKGVVKDRQQVRLAVKRAQNVKGVVRVESRLQTQATEK